MKKTWNKTAQNKTLRTGPYPSLLEPQLDTISGLGQPRGTHYPRKPSRIGPYPSKADLEEPRLQTTAMGPPKDPQTPRENGTG